MGQDSLRLGFGRMQARLKRSELPRGEETRDRLFVSLCDSGYYPGLRALLNSICIYHGSEISVRIYDRGLTQDQLRELSEHPLPIEVTSVDKLLFEAPGPWEAKQMLLADCISHARCVCLLDTDMVLTAPLWDVFSQASQGLIVGGSDAGVLEFGDEYRVYRPDLPGRKQFYLNSGLLCLDVRRHWDVVGLWAFSAKFAGYAPHGGFPLCFPGHGDQGLLNAIIATLGKADDVYVLPHGLWHEPHDECAMSIIDDRDAGRLVVWNQKYNKRQRLLHTTGPKWWREDGAAHLQAFGDKLRCFEYFAAIDPCLLREDLRTSEKPY